MVDLTNHLETKNTSGTCPICLENTQKTYIIKCSHIFHTNCLEEWAKVSNSCPICRKELFDQISYQKLKIENSNSLNTSYNYHMLDVQERERFATGSREYLLEQLTAIHNP